MRALLLPVVGTAALATILATTPTLAHGQTLLANPFEDENEGREENVERNDRNDREENEENEENEHREDREEGSERDEPNDRSEREGRVDAPSTSESSREGERAPPDYGHELNDPDDPRFEPNEAFFEPVGVASRFVLPSQRAPAGVTVVTAEEIARAGHRSVGEALAWVPGLFTSYDLLNHHVGARGLFGGSRSGSRNFRIMINGRPVAFVQSGTYMLGPELVPVSAIERIEVMLGPASALYGAGALLGAINIVTRRPVYEGETRASGLLRADGGALDQRVAGGEGLLTITGDGWNVLAAVSGAYENRSGLSMAEGPFAPRNPGVSQRDTAAPRSFLLATDVAIGRGRLTAQVIGQASDRSAEFYDISVLTHRTRLDVQQLVASVGYERAFGTSQWVRAGVGYTHGWPGPRDEFDLRRSDGRLVRRSFSSHEVTAQLELLHEFGEGGLFLAGIDGQLDLERMARIDLVDPSGQTTLGTAPPTQTIADVGVYGQLLLPVVERLTLSAGVRYDYHTVIRHAVSARLGGIAQLTDRAAFKVFAGRSYRAPSPEQLYANPLAPLDIAGNEDLPAQYLNSVEALLDWFLHRDLRLVATTFYNYSDDALAYVSRAGRLEAVPFDAQTFGGELRGRYARTFSNTSLDVQVAIALQETWTDEMMRFGFPEKVVPDNESFPRAMTWAALNLRWLSPRVGFRLGWRYVSERVPSQSNLRAQGTTDLRFPGYTLPAFHLLDLGVTAGAYALGSSSKISFGLWLRNALDARYAEIGFNGVDVPSLGRTLWLRATLEL